MSGDRKGGGPVRRPRAIKQPRVPPGQLADLKALVYELYLQAGTPTLDDIAAWVAGDDELAGAPGRDTIGRIIGDTGMPASQADVVAVATVLARAARWDPQDSAGRARDLWVAARMAVPVGVPLTKVNDPFALEVHRPITVEGAGDFPPLAPYVRRAHDDRLARVVARAAGGGSVMAVLVAGSSAGKTRACWEALEPLRRAGGWRLWHPYNPTRPEAVLRELPGVGPRTVVWLNETQDCLGPGGDGGERVAAGLRSLLADPVRAPVLVLGTLWPDHHAALTRLPGSQVRLILEGTMIEVPEEFTGADLAAVRHAAPADARLALAVERSGDGRITQYLAGGPALLERFYAAPPTAKALICAAMDARRLGMSLALPYAFLEEAAPGYLAEVEWDTLPEDWLEQALAYAAVPCKGIRGPVTRIRPASARPRGGRRAAPACEGGGESAYRLADYLHQYGRSRPADQIPPAEFWSAAADHAHPGDLKALGDAARERGLYRDAAQLYKNATTHGNPAAARVLVDHLHRLHPGDHRPARWAAAHALDNPYDMADLLRSLREAGAGEQVTVLAERAGAYAPLDEPLAVAGLLDSLQEVGAEEQAAILAERAAAHASLDNPYAAAGLLRSLRVIKAGEQTAVLLARDPAAHASLDDLFAVADLLDSLREAGAKEQAARLAERAAAHAPLDDPLVLFAVARLLRSLQEAGAEEQAAALEERAVAHAPLSVPLAVFRLLANLQKTGAEEKGAVLLAGDPATYASLEDPRGVAELLDGLREAGPGEQAVVLLAGNSAAHVSLDIPGAVVRLLGSLREAGVEARLEEQAAVFAGRPVARIPLDHPEAVTRPLDSLREAQAKEQAVVLLAGDPAADTPLDEPLTVAVLLERLHETGAHEQESALAERAAIHTPLGDRYAVARLLESLRGIGAQKQASVLAARLPAAGMFTSFLEQSGPGDRFRFGREADGTPTDPWDWDDLD